MSTIDSLTVDNAISRVRIPRNVPENARYEFLRKKAIATLTIKVKVSPMAAERLFHAWLAKQRADNGLASGTPARESLKNKTYYIGSFGEVVH